MYKVSKAAFNDLVHIGQYTESKWGKAKRDEYLDEIERRFNDLVTPKLGIVIKDRGDIRKGCFSNRINQHTIVFRRTTYGVRIIRVLHKSMDPPRHL